MTDKFTPEELLRKITEELVDEVLGLDETALAEFFRTAGIDEQALVDEGRGAARRAIEQADAEVRRRARDQFEAAVTNAVQRTYGLPVDRGQRRVLLGNAVRRNPGLGPGITLQHRDLSELSDDDVESQLRKLQELGLLDSEGNFV